MQPRADPPHKGEGKKECVAPPASQRPDARAGAAAIGALDLRRGFDRRRRRRGRGRVWIWTPAALDLVPARHLGLDVARSLCRRHAGLARLDRKAKPVLHLLRHMRPPAFEARVRITHAGLGATAARPAHRPEQQKRAGRSAIFVVTHPLRFVRLPRRRLSFHHLFSSRFWVRWEWSRGALCARGLGVISPGTKSPRGWSAAGRYILVGPFRLRACALRRTSRPGVP